MADIPVDIVIAAHNEASMLSACLEAVRRQEYPSQLVRTIVVDDRSSDTTAMVAAAGGATVIEGTGRGAAAARNAGIEAGAAPLIGFLDAHSLPAPDWIATLAENFADPQLGGCQARIINRAEDTRVREYLERSRLHSNEDVVEQTVSGKRSLFPWLLTGNCMYRRSALDDAGLFDIRLPACEDVDLAWRVVLAGWLLGYDDRTEAVHYDGSSWRRFLRKGWRYGRGAAALTALYEAHGAKGKFAPRSLLRADRVETVSNLYYWAGFTYERTRHGRSLVAREVADVVRFRTSFVWEEGVRLRLSPRSVYWFRDGISVVVQLDRRERIVLDGVGDFIWRRLVAEDDRRAVIAAIVKRYQVATATAAYDLDEMVEELRDAGVVVSG